MNTDEHRQEKIITNTTNGRIRRMKTGSFAIIRDGRGGYLISHRRDLDLWNLPGGGVEPGETPWDAVVREVREETGLEVVVRRLQGVYAKADSEVLVFSFECVITGGEAAPSDEADEHQYFTLDDIPANFSPRQMERLRDAERHPDTVILKTQTLPSSREHLAVLAERQRARGDHGRGGQDAGGAGGSC